VGVVEYPHMLDMPQTKDYLEELEHHQQTGKDEVYYHMQSLLNKKVLMRCSNQLSYTGQCEA
jgi:hypothetical protein